MEQVELKLCHSQTELQTNSMIATHEPLANNPSPALRWLAILLALAALVAGWFMPEFYDWTGADQSRPAPVVGWIALAIIGVDFVAIFGLFALHIRDRSKRQNLVRENDHLAAGAQESKQQFSLRQLMVAITIVALLLTMGRWIPPLIVVLLVYGLTLAWAISISLRSAPVGWRIGLIVWLQFMPFLWLVRKPKILLESLELFGMLLALPSFFPLMYLNAHLQIEFESGQWIVILFTTISFAIGIWLAGQGQKRSLAFSLMVLTFSVFGSFILHALMRA